MFTFWAFIVHIIFKCFLNVNRNSKKNQPKNTFNFKIIIPYLLVASVLIVGIICLFLGIKDTYYTNKKTKNYITTLANYRNRNYNF